MLRILPIRRRRSTSKPRVAQRTLGDGCRDGCTLKGCHTRAPINGRTSEVTPVEPVPGSGLGSLPGTQGALRDPGLRCATSVMPLQLLFISLPFLDGLVGCRPARGQSPRAARWASSETQEATGALLGRELQGPGSGTPAPLTRPCLLPTLELRAVSCGESCPVARTIAGG